MRVAGSNAIFGVPETSLAIIPGAGGTQRLPRLVGQARAMEMIFTAKRISADDAEKIGLINHVVDQGNALVVRCISGVFYLC
jgi:enoyl-CoA hydratase/carnithine racemase